MKPLPVTRTYLPPLERYLHYLEQIWVSGKVTTFGNLERTLVEALKRYLEVPELVLTCNGATALQVAIHALGIKGEIITTPFSYVATTSAIYWTGNTPVFADIEPEYLTIDPDAVLRKITPHTAAILATHIFGNPCAIERLEQIAREHNIPLIFDAAHCFGVRYRGRNILNYGDVSIISFHATKVFHTIEGGGLVCQSPEIAHKLFYTANQGHKGKDQSFYGPGTNGKLSELHAAIGLCILQEVDRLIKAREKVTNCYDQLLKSLPDIKPMVYRRDIQRNYAYYPVIFPDEPTTLKVKETLEASMIYPRRYFYPALNRLNYLSYTPAPVAEDVSTRILCLPISHDMEERDCLRVVEAIKKAL